MYTEGGVYWPTPESERIPVYTLELSRIDDDEAYVETPMKYSKIYHSDDEAFEDAEKLAAEYANEDGKFEVYIMAGEYQIGDGEDIYGDPYVDGSIQTGRGWKMVKEGFMSNIGKDGQRLYSIMYSADGWDGSVQEYGKSKEDAIQNAIAKGKLDGDEDIVKIVDLGEKGEYLESRRFNEKSVPYMILAELVKITAAGEKTIKVDEVPSYKMAFEMLQDYILEDPDMDDYVVEKYEDYMTGRDVHGKEKEIRLLEKNGEIGERCVSGFYEIVLRAAEQANPNEQLGDYFLDDDYYAESKKRGLVKESYEVSPEIEDRLNSILADEFLAAEFYRLAELAMKGNKQHLLSEIAEENGEDELEDHFKNLSEWMQSKGLRVVTNHDEMLDITGATVFTVEDGDSTEEIVDKLIQSEEEAIEAYENLIPETDLDLRVMLCGFLKDEREHLKALMDARDEMGVIDDADYEIDDDEVDIDTYSDEEDPDDDDVDEIDVDVGDEDDDTRETVNERMLTMCDHLEMAVEPEEKQKVKDLYGSVMDAGNINALDELIDLLGDRANNDEINSILERMREWIDSGAASRHGDAISDGYERAARSGANLGD